MILGLDGAQKMSKSRNNAVMLRATADETSRLIKKAKSDSDRHITYDPDGRPEVANLLRITALASGQTPESIAEEIGDGGAGALKAMCTEALNEYLSPIREKRRELEKNPDYIKNVLKKGIETAREIAASTLAEVRRVMNMEI
jgi:tryptophanyl-tRNA synthetase